MLEVEATEWLPSWRIVVKPTPPKHVFHRLGGADEAEILDEIEQLGAKPTTPDEAERLMHTPFFQLDPVGSRFSDGSFGIYYAARSLQTAMEETRYHRARFLSATKEGPGEIRMQVLLADLCGEFHTLIGRIEEFPELYHPQDYRHSQIFGRRLFETGSTGLTYDSVRHPGGYCVAVFEPGVLSHARMERQLRYVWDGNTVRAITEIQSRQMGRLTPINIPDKND